jgi:O-antigen chain-terminating methyltransferase
VYLPYIAEVKTVTKRSPVLDLGCGRGEWLQLLKENGYAVLGIDANKEMIRRCKELGLCVKKADAIDFLKSQRKNRFGAITGFHIVEHLALKSLIRLCDECLRVLTPGGVVIFETPNPENLIMGACNFYMDPTRRNPLPPAALSFIVEHRGFVNVQIKRLHEILLRNWTTKYCRIYCSALRITRLSDIRREAAI